MNDFVGNWDTSFGPLELVVHDGEIRGTYPSDNGRVILRQEGRKLVGFWIERHSSEHCGDLKDGSPHWGNLSFSFNEDLSAFEGQWSYCTNPLGGAWNGTFLSPPAVVTFRNCTLAESIASMEYEASIGSTVAFLKIADGTWLQTVGSFEMEWQLAGCEDDTITLTRIDNNTGQELELKAILDFKENQLRLFDIYGSYSWYPITSTSNTPNADGTLSRGSKGFSNTADSTPAPAPTVSDGSASEQESDGISKGSKGFSNTTDPLTTTQTRGAVTGLAGPILDQFIKPLSQGSFCWRDSHGRGAGQPLGDCPAGQDKSGALCYEPCKQGFSGAGPICWSQCPQGYTDDGATCRKDPIIQPKTSYPRGAGTALTCGPGKEYQAGLCYPTCGAGWSATATVCYQDCPSGYRDDGLYCGKVSTSSCPGGWQDIGVSCKKPSRDRGVGTAVDSCPQGSERNGALCYPKCRAGYGGNGPVCWSLCPNGFVDDGATCRKSGDIQSKESYPRGSGTSMACAEGLQQSGALCYPPCENGAAGIGPVCWGKCPSSMPYRCGAGCAVTENDCMVAIRNMFLTGVKMGVDIVETAVTGGAAEVLAGIVPTDAESAEECAVEVGQAGVDHLLPGLSDLPQSFTSMSGLASTGARAELVGILNQLAGELSTTTAPTGAHVLAAFAGHLDESARDGLITQIALAAEGEQTHPLDIISNVPCVGYGITDFLGSFSYYQCSRFPDNGLPGGQAADRPVLIEDVQEQKQQHVTLSTGLGLTQEALNVEPSGIEVQMEAKNTVNEQVVREFLGASYTPELARKILERFKSGKPLDLRATQGRTAALPQNGQIEVIQATYGGNCNATPGNVTDALAGACNYKTSCEYTVDHRILGDPVPMCAKDYVATWKCSNGGQERTETIAAEAGVGGKTVTLRCP